MTAQAQARYRERLRAEDPEAWRVRARDEQAAFRRQHPKKKSAWNKVYNAVKSGRLIRPTVCGRCSVSCTPEASHDDYDKPLEVEWLCKSCHSDKDAKLRRSK